MSAAEVAAAANQRAETLFRTIVPKEAWTTLQTVEVVGKSGNRYEIRLNGMTENIVGHRPNGSTFRICGGPWLHNDYATPQSMRSAYTTELVAQVDQEIWNQAFMDFRASGERPLTLPVWDFWLGQYLALKYDEEEFLKRAVVIGF